MTGRLSDYDQGLLQEIGLFADTRLAEQVRAVMVARNNAEARLADTQAQLAEARQRIVARQDIIADLLDSVGEERRRADAAEARLEAVKGKRDEIVREAVRVSAEYLRTTHWDGNGCGTNGTSGCSRCYGPSPADADEVAADVLDVAWPVIAAALSVAPQPEPVAPADALGLNEDAKRIVAELREMWQRALEREGNLASAVADTVWKATQYGTTEDGDTAAYLVPKGTMHRLVGVAQSNGARVPVSFRAAPQPSGGAS